MPPAPAAGLIEIDVVAVVLSDLLLVLVLLLLSVVVSVLVSVVSELVVFSSFPVLVAEVVSEAVVEWAVSVAEVSVVWSGMGGQHEHGR